MSEASAPRPGAAPPRHRSLAEWTSFGIAALVVLMVAGLVVYVWVSMPTTPPQIELTRSGPVRAEGGQFYVPFTVTNRGGMAAEAVQLIGELHVDGEVVEDGEQQIDVLGSDETREGAFVFSRDPEEGELTLRVASFQQP